MHIGALHIIPLHSYKQRWTEPSKFLFFLLYACLRNLGDIDSRDVVMEMS